jgi:hypothetical protein
MRFVIKKSVAGIAVTKEPSRSDFGDRVGHFPTYAPIPKLRARVEAGMGELMAEQRAVQKLFRTQDETAEQPRHVVVIEDVTRGLRLEPDEAVRVQRAVQDTNPEFTVKSQTPRLFHARSKLIELMRSMALDGDDRLEITKRAVSWWKKSYQTEYDRRRDVPWLRWDRNGLQKAMYVSPRKRRMCLEW